MDFFEQQEIARKRTGWLVTLFILAVLAIIALVYVVVAGFVIYMQGEELRPDMLWDERILLGVGLGVPVLVGLGSLYKSVALSAGGHTVADMLGGRPIDLNTGNPHERQLLNVVEEMAIASGMPVPTVYLLSSEPGINAFAAGYAPDDAVIGVTRGCMEKLTRDELQGVIAHEFSHVFNGDMRLNIRLIGVIFGILLIALMGRFTLRAALSGTRGPRRGKRGSPVALIALGAALLIIGYVGILFGNLIKAAVSRQREYLADAAAVQFTRNPAGISGALRKIGGFAHGSRLQDPHAEEVSHMLFSRGYTSMLVSLFATHPPLAERIRRIDPGFDGTFPAVTEEAEAIPQAGPAQRPHAAGLWGGVDSSSSARQELGSALFQIGQPTQAHIGYAHWLVESLPERIRSAVHETYTAQALIYALLLNTEEGPRRIQLERLEDHIEAPILKETLDLQALIDQLDPRARLPLIDLTLPALRDLSPGQYKAFRKTVVMLIRADQKLDLFEWVLQRIIVHHLEPHFSRPRTPAVRHHSLRPLADHCAHLLCTLACTGQADRQQAHHAFQQGARELDLSNLEMPPVERCSLQALDRALEALNTVAPKYKRQVLAACAACITADKHISVKEGELFRAIADSLDCPVPPLLRGQRLG